MPNNQPNYDPNLWQPVGGPPSDFDRFAAAIEHVESGGNPYALSPKGARGLYQIMPQTAREYGVSPDDLWNPHINRNLFNRIMTENLARYGGDKRKASWAYNAGHEAVAKGHQPAETRSYLRRVFDFLGPSSAWAEEPPSGASPLEATPGGYDPKLWQLVGGSKTPAPARVPSSYDSSLWQPVAGSKPPAPVETPTSPPASVPSAPAPSRPPLRVVLPSPRSSPEVRREAVEGPAPELADAPVANAVMAGMLTPGALARVGLEGGASGLRAALGSGVNFGVQQGLQDWVDRLLSGPLQRHPYLREMLGTAGGVGADLLLHKIAQKRALEQPETPVFETPQATTQPSKPVELSPAQEVEPEEPLPLEPLTATPSEPQRPQQPGAEPIEPLPSEPLIPVPQPKDEFQQAIATNNGKAAQTALHRELERHPAATVSGMRVGDIKRDPDRFQYKRVIDRATGADPALRDVKVYDPGFSGVMTVYHDADGQYYVVNGHGRMAAVERIQGSDATHRVQVIESRPQGHPDAVQGAIKYGNSPQQARTYGAMINIVEGRGTDLDAALVFRQEGMNTEDMVNAGIALSPTEGKTQRAVALSRTSPMVWRSVDTGIMPKPIAVTIGRELGDNPIVQDAVYHMLKTKAGNIRNISTAKLAEMIRLAKSAGETTERTKDLFGESEIKKSLIREQADVIVGLKQRLRGEKRLFGTTAKRAEELEAAGVGQIDVETGEALSAAAAHNLGVLKQVAYSGPVHQVILKAAREIAESPGKKAGIIEDAYGQVVDELNKILPQQAEPSPQGGLFGG